MTNIINYLSDFNAVPDEGKAVAAHIIWRNSFMQPVMDAWRGLETLLLERQTPLTAGDAVGLPRFSLSMPESIGQAVIKHTMMNEYAMAMDFELTAVGQLLEARFPGKVKGAEVHWSKIGETQRLDFSVTRDVETLLSPYIAPLPERAITGRGM